MSLLVIWGFGWGVNIIFIPLPTHSTPTPTPTLREVKSFDWNETKDLSDTILLLYFWLKEKCFGNSKHFTEAVSWDVDCIYLISIPTHPTTPFSSVVYHFIDLREILYDWQAALHTFFTNEPQICGKHDHHVSNSFWFYENVSYTLKTTISNYVVRL